MDRLIDFLGLRIGGGNPRSWACFDCTSYSMPRTIPDANRVRNLLRLRLPPQQPRPSDLSTGSPSASKTALDMADLTKHSGVRARSDWATRQPSRGNDGS